MTPSTASQQSHSHSHSTPVSAGPLMPPLRNALSSLNVNLDYELARYRYAKRGGANPQAAPPQFQPRPRSLKLITVPAASPQGRSQSIRTVTPPPPPPNPRITKTAPRPEPPVAATAAAPLADTLPSEASPQSEVAALRSALVRQSAPPAATAYLASSAALLEPCDPPDEDYSYAGAEPSMMATESMPSGWPERFNTPLGLGALMLLLVASAGFGFVLVNPSVIQPLVSNTPLARFWPTQAASEGETTLPATAGDPDLATGAEGNPLSALSPDLSQKEFTDLDLNTLSTLPSETPPTGLAPKPLNQTPGTVGAAEGQSDRPPSAVNDTSEITIVNEIPRTTTAPPQAVAPPPTYGAPTAPPTPPPAAAPAAPPAAASEPAVSNQPASAYYVVTDYTGDPSLDAARQVVGDAYVRNFDVGARIQLGAFNTEAGAAALIEELQSQGLEAQVYEP